MRQQPPDPEIVAQFREHLKFLKTDASREGVMSSGILLSGGDEACRS
ncbi:MAG: hypothetical protein NZ556_05575 [Fimbriimonadales bacterium]|nr:hypothetical protein [Fimbriimonadales bacterium]